jgi:hypothetical protein
MNRIALTLVLATFAIGAQADTLRSQVEAGNLAVSSAIKQKDFVKLEKVIKSEITPNFAYLEEGRQLTVDRMVAGMKMGLSRMGKLTVVKTKILSSKEMGSTATFTNLHTIEAKSTGPDKKIHTVLMTGTSVNTYVKKGTIWKLSKMDWKNGAMTMDGKPMDMSKMGGK